MTPSKHIYTHVAAMLLCAALSAATIGAVAAQSDQPASPEAAITLAQTIRMALQSSNDLAVATRNLDRDAAAVDENVAAGRPQISSTDTYQYLDTPIAIQFGPQTILAERQKKEFITGAATLPLDISGRIHAMTKAAELQEMADRFQRDRIYNARVLEAETTYFDLLRAEHQVDVAKAALQNAQTQEAIAARQFAGGVGQKIDDLRAQSQVATANQNLLAAQNALGNEQVAFNDLIGKPLSTPVNAADAAGASTGATVATDAADVSSVGAPIPPFYTPDLTPPPALEDAIHTAELARPELRADQVEIQAADKQIQIARTGLYPTLSLSATGDYYPTTDFETPIHSIGVYAVNLTIPLYDGGLSHDQERQARDAKLNAADTFSSDQTTVEMQVRQAYANLQTAAQQITAANAALVQAIAARRLAQVRYANGVALYLEVTDAETALTQAETTQVNAVYGYLTAKAQLDNAIGAPELNPGL
jgi:outer membrane protein TolC